MHFLFTEDKNLNTFKSLLVQMEENPDIDSIGIFNTFNNQIDINEFQAIISKCSKLVYGGFFPGIIYNSTLYKKGYLLTGHTDMMRLQSHIIPDISKKTISELEKEVSDLNLDLLNTKTVLLLVDAFSDGIKNLVDSFFNVHSLNYNYIGGGVGDLDFVSRPCLFTNEGIYKDAALVISINRHAAVGVNHGMSPIEGPFVITKSDKNIVYEIEYEPALQFYRKILKNHYPKEITKKNFYEIARDYPLGLPKVDSEAIVRGPIKIIDSSAIKFVGPIPENSTAFLMSGNVEKQMQGAINATLAADGENVAPFCFVLDCLSRATYLADNYSKTLSLIKLRDEMVFGGLVIGEIANQQKRYLEYYSKTCIISRMLF